MSLEVQEPSDVSRPTPMSSPTLVSSPVTRGRGNFRRHGRGKFVSIGKASR